MNFNAWRTSGDNALSSSIDEASRAASIWALINRDPVSITIKRGSSTLSAQTVRVTINNSDDGQQGGQSDAVSGKRGAIIFGIRNHATLTDTDIAIGDMFSLDYDEDGNGDEIHRVVNIVHIPGGIEAHTEVIQ